MNQHDWRLCHKCRGLFLAGGTPSRCPAGGAHDKGASPDYVLSDTEPIPSNVLSLPVEASLTGYDAWIALSISSPAGGNVGIDVVSTGESVPEGASPTAISAKTDGWGTAVAAVAADGAGVSGSSNTGRGVVGHSESSDGVQGVSQNANGVFGEGALNGVYGKSGESGRAIYGENTAGGDGVGGVSTSGTGVFGAGETGVHGKCDGSGRAVRGENTANGDGVQGRSQRGTGVAGVSKTGTGVYARSASGPAGFFEGHVEVTGEIRLVGGDCAEEFSAPPKIAAGTVMVIDDGGDLSVSNRPYDKRVAGVVAGAGCYKPGLILDSDGETKPGLARQAISLIGKTYCRVDASRGAIAVGDLLTTADVPGCAMRATDRDRAFGAVLGKALAPLTTGSGLIPILVALQ